VPHILDIGCGIEVGVAATKTFLGQLVGFLRLALSFAEGAAARSSDDLARPGVVGAALPPDQGAGGRSRTAAAPSWPHLFADTQDV